MPFKLKVVFDAVAVPLACDDELVDLDADVVVKVVVEVVIEIIVINIVPLCFLLPFDVVVDLVYQDDDADVSLVVDDVV